MLLPSKPKPRLPFRYVLAVSLLVAPFSLAGCSSETSAPEYSKITARKRDQINKLLEMQGKGAPKGKNGVRRP